MALQPLRDIVLLRAVELPTQTESGIALAMDKDIFPDRGIVIAFGKQVDSVREGEEVIFRQGAGVKVKHGTDGELLAMRAEDIWTVIEQ